MRHAGLLALAGLIVAAGCSSESSPPRQKAGRSILGQKTQEIGEFDPKAGRAVSDSKIRIDTPGLGALQAYGPIAEQISALGIDYQLKLYYAEHGRYPKDHDEFMTEIIKRNNVALPKLPGGHEYQYDVDEHKLVVVKPPAPDVP